MPFYDYRCKLCLGEFEEAQSISDEPLVVCPSCGMPSLERLISSGTSFVLKGGCWASDGYSSTKKQDG